MSINNSISKSTNNIKTINSMQTNTINTAKTNSNSNNPSKIISSHYSKDRMAMTSMEENESTKESLIKPSVIMMKDNDINQKSVPFDTSSDGTDNTTIDIDLQGIPQFILDLQTSQPTLNIMTCGDVSHGKSTLLYAISGEKTGKDSRELKGNMTIRLGYTSCKIWKCLLCPRPQCYFSTHSDTSIKKVQCAYCMSKPSKDYVKYHKGNSQVILVRHISFVDVPGHAQLMQTMVSATSVADGAILVIDSSKPCPGKQTSQHMDAINLLGLMKENQLIIAQNKIDLIRQSEACLSYEQIRNYLATFGNDKLTYNAPIIPISAQSQLNIDALCNSIIHNLPKFSKKLLVENEYKCADEKSVETETKTNISDERSLKSSDLYMNIIRSFDVNRAKDILTMDDIDKITGGIIGGAVLNGHVQIGQLIEIRPGYLRRKETKKYDSATKTKLQPQWTAQPIKTTIKSLKYGKNNALNGKGFPGGNVGIQTNIDPSLTKADGMCGHIVIDANNPNPPPVFDKFIMSYSFLCAQKSWKRFEEIRVNIGSFKMEAEVIKTNLNEYNGIMCVLKAPICANIGDTVGICRQNKKKEWSFVGGGIIRKTKNIKIESDKRWNKQQQSKPKPEPTVEGHEEETKEEKENDGLGMVHFGRRAFGTDSQNKTVIHLNYQQRNGKKGVTTIVGLPKKVKLKKLMVKMKKKWSCGATIREDAEKGEIIQIQGDFRREIPAFLVKQGIADKSQITIHGY